ncbi:MAG: hypothetical protein PHP88_12655 [bacterium]|nr:hypothetical protein [bacterium]
MKGRSRGWGVPVVAAAFLLMAGCSVNSTFVYKPGAPVVGGSKLPMKIAVLPFKDGTEDFTKRGSVFNPENLVYNIAKTGFGGQMTALTPEVWAKAFADDMAASGAFRAVRFMYSPTEMVDEEIYIEGTLEKAYAAAATTSPSEFALRLRALRRADNRLAWEKEVTRVWKTTGSIYGGCGIGQCAIDRYHAALNEVIQGIFAEARADLVATLAGLSGSRAGEGSLPPAASPSAPASESPEQTIDRILKEK